MPIWCSIEISSFPTIFFSTTCFQYNQGERNSFYLHFIVIYTACPWFYSHFLCVLYLFLVMTHLLDSWHIEKNDRFRCVQWSEFWILIYEPIYWWQSAWNLKECFLANNKPNAVDARMGKIAFNFKRNETKPSESVRNSQKMDRLTSCINFVYLCVSNISYTYNVYIVICACAHVCLCGYVCMIKMVFLEMCMDVCLDRVKNLFSIKWIKLTDKMTKLCMIKQTINENISISK